jgi:hypothetical protein
MKRVLTAVILSAFATAPAIASTSDDPIRPDITLACRSLMPGGREIPVGLYWPLHKIMWDGHIGNIEWANGVVHSSDVPSFGNPPVNMEITINLGTLRYTRSTAASRADGVIDTSTCRMV